MKAVVKLTTGKGDTVFTDMPEPNPGPGQVKIAVKAASICASDIHAYRTDILKGRIVPPMIIGHEGSGVVVDIGQGVQNVKIGDRVVAETTFETCMNCEYCRTSRFNLCSHRKGLGSAANGFFAEYVIAIERSVHIIPDSLSYEAAALTEPLACVTHAVMEQACVSPSDIAAVFGPGPIGLLTAQVAKAAGAMVILCGYNDGLRLEFGKKLGVNITVDTKETDVRKVVEEMTGGIGVDVVFEASGAKEAIRAGFDILKQGGQYIMTGLTEEPAIPFAYNRLLYNKELRIAGVKSTLPSSWIKARRLMDQRLVNMEALITHRLPMQDWLKGYELVQNKEALKVILHP